MNQNKNIYNNPERAVEVVGPELVPLFEQLERGNISTSQTLVAEARDSLYERGEQFTMTEAEAVGDYFGFLGKVGALAASDSTPRGQELVRMVQKYAHETTFLTAEARKQALLGLLERQAAFLREDPGRSVSFYVPASGIGKSEDLLAGEAKSLIGQYAPDVAPRVDVSAVLVEGHGARNVLLHDWSVSGSQLNNAISDVLRTAGGSAASAAAKASLEVNLLVAREDQLNDKFAAMNDVEQTYGMPGHVPVVAYFRTSAQRQYEGPMPTGTHSSVDYGFESELANMRRYYVDQTHESLNLPYLASVTRTQREQ